jgi:uncharacterized membrane protein
MTLAFITTAVLQYFLLPLVLLGLVTPWLVRESPSANPRFARHGPWLLMALFVLIAGVMASLRYFAYRTAYHDLGIYDQRFWSLSQAGFFASITGFLQEFGHFSPLLTLHATLYRLYPDALVLIWLQVVVVAAGVYPVYRLAECHLGERAALAFATAYLLCPSVWYAVLMDFHPDHLVLPLLLFGFYALDRGWAITALCLALLIVFVKEQMGLTAIAFGAYAVIVMRRYLLGLVLLVGGLAVFVLVIEPRYGGVLRTEIGTLSYGYLGSTVPEILRTIVLSPKTWLLEAVKPPKLHFLFLMLAPLMFLPLFAPAVLLVAVPGFALALLSQVGARYQIWSQYVNVLIPTLLVAAIFGYERLLAAPSWERSRVLSRHRERLLTGWLLASTVYFNVLLSPSPISTTFWLGWSGLPAQTRWPPGAFAPVRPGEWYTRSEWVRWPLHWTAYVVGAREREIREALHRYVPADPGASVSAQNNLNSSYLAHRFRYVVFPTPADYVVVDARRPQWASGGTLDTEAFMAEIASLRRQRELLHGADGLMIFGPAPPAAPPGAATERTPR